MEHLWLESISKDHHQPEMASLTMHVLENILSGLVDELPPLRVSILGDSRV